MRLSPPAPWGLLLLTTLPTWVMAQEQAQTSWKDEESMIQQHLEKISEQQHDLAQEMNVLNQQLQEHHHCVEELQGSLSLLHDHQEQQRHTLGRQLQQALKWDLKQQGSQDWGLNERDHSAKVYLLTKLLEEQKQHLRGQLQLIKEFDAQIQHHLDARTNLRAQLDEREAFFDQLIHNDQQLKQFLALCHEQQQEEQVLLQQEAEAIPKPTKEQLATQPFNPQALSVPLAFFSGRHQKDFFGATVISGREGEPISAVGPGQIIFSDQMKGLGRVVMIEHDDGFLSLYGNCAKIYKKLGDQVATGEDIATVGQSGQLGVSALYFELRQDTQLIPPQWGRETG